MYATAREHSTRMVPLYLKSGELSNPPAVTFAPAPKDRPGNSWTGSHRELLFSAGSMDDISSLHADRVWRNL